MPVTLEQILCAHTAALHAELVARGLDGQIKLMGGGLVENAGNPARNHYVVDEGDRREPG